MNFINWGSETPEQLAIRKKLDELALYEQIARMNQARKSQGQSPFGGASGSRRSTSVSTELIAFAEFGRETWQYYLLDYDNLRVSGPLDTGVTTPDYNLDNIQIVQDKGYMLLFRLDQDSNDYKMVFIRTDGTIVETISGYTSDLSTGSYDGYFIVAYDYDAGFIWYFDGEKLVADSTTVSGASSYSFGTSEDLANRHGIFLSKTEGTSTSYYLLTMDGAKLLTMVDSEEEPDVQVYASLYSVSEKVLILKYLSSNNKALSLSAYDKNGLLANSYEFDDDDYLQWNYYHYGSDKLFMILTNADGPNNIYRLLQYSEKTDEFKSWTQERLANLEYSVRLESISTSSFRDTAISENAAIVFYQVDGFPGNNMINVSNCVIHSVFDTNDPKIYSFGGTSIKTDLMTGSDAFFTWADFGDGVMKILSIGQNAEEITDLEINYSTINSILSDITGKKYLHCIELSSGGWQVYLFNSVGSSYIGLDLTEYSNFNNSYEYDTIWIEADATQWYINSSLNQWEQITSISDWNDPNSYYTPTKVNPGQVVFLSEVKIPYTHTQLELNGELSSEEDFISDGEIVGGTELDFGASSSYFTNLYPGLFILCAKDTDITQFGINGNIGADGNGQVDTYQYSYGGYTAFVKRVYGTGDPSINHIIIIEGDGSGVEQSVDLGSEFDRHIITGIPASSSELHYLLMAKPSGIKITDLEIETIVENYIDLVVDKSLSTILTDLGANYEYVTGVLNDRNHSTDDRIYWFSDEGSFGEISDGGEDMYDNANIISTNYSSPTFRIITRDSLVTKILPFDNPLDYYIGSDGVMFIFFDPENDGNLSIAFYDLEGNERQRIKTSHVNYDNSNLVKNRGYVHCFSKEYDGENLYYRWGVYMINSKGAKEISFTTLDNTSLFEYSLNDYPWYD